MKTKALIIVMIVFSGVKLFAQNELDALRYSQTYFFGTARAMSMGGAFGALGANISSMGINPAGIALYQRNDLSITPDFYFNQTTTKFLNQTGVDNKSGFRLNNAGFVCFLDTKTESNNPNINFGFSYNLLNNFDENITMRGINKENSITDIFAMKAFGTHPDDLDYFNEGLAFSTWLIDTIRGSHNEYYSALPTLGQQQRKVGNIGGRMDEYLFSIGINYSHLVYFGASVGLQNVNYSQNSKIEELDVNNSIDDFKSLCFTQNLKTTGKGFSFKLGAIVRPVDWMRIGLAVHTPVYLNLHDEYSSSMESQFDNNDMYIDNSPDGEYDYKVTTPYKAIGSLAFIFGKQGLISFDYEFTDYKSVTLKADDYGFFDENQSIQERCKAASNFRAGAEYRFGIISLRGGFAYYANPYLKNDNHRNDPTLVYTGGIGISEGNYYMDVAYSSTLKRQTEFLYDVPEGQTLLNANIDSRQNRLLLTLGVRF